MAVTIDDVHVQTFYGNLIHLSQQKDHRLTGAYRYKDLRAEAANFDRLAKVGMTEYTDNHGDSPVNDAPFSRRKLTPKNYEWGDIVDRKNIVRMLMDPTSDLVMAGAAAVNRQKDQMLIDASTGNAVAVSGGSDTNVALPAGQTIPAGGTGLTFDKIREAKKKLDDIDAPTEDRFAVIGSHQLNTDLLAIPEATSSDYNPVHTLLEGRVAHWMGFKWILSNQLALATADRSCLFFQKGALGLGLNEDFYHYVAPLPRQRNAYQVYVEVIGDATRIEDELMVEVVCLES